MTREPLRWRVAFALLLVLGLALRVGLALAAEPQEVSDAADYRDLAVGLLDHGEYGAIGNSGWNDGLEFRAYRPPGYPFMRAALMLVFGRGPGPALWLNVVAELIALVFVMAIARHVIGRGGALVAGAIFATFVLFTASLMTESLSMMLWAMLAWSVATRTHVEVTRVGIAMGVVLGVAILVRPVSVFWIAPLAWPLVRTEPRAHLRPLAAVMVPALLLVGAWTVRNAMLFGRVVSISTNLGVHNAPDFGIPWTRLAVLRHRGLSEPDADRALTHEILAAAFANPVPALTLYATRLRDLFSVTPKNCWELAYARERVYRSSPASLAILDAATVLWRVFNVLALVGMLRAAFDRRTKVRALIGPFVLFVALQCVLSRGDVRLMAPAIPMLAIFAAYLITPRQA